RCRRRGPSPQRREPRNRPLAAPAPIRSSSRHHAARGSGPSSRGGQASRSPAGFTTAEALRGSASAVKGHLLAVLLVLTDADLAPLQETVREQLRVVRLRDPDRDQQDGLRAADLAVYARH